MLQADYPSSDHKRYDSEKSESSYSKDLEELDEKIESPYHEKEVKTPHAEIGIKEDDYTSSKPKREKITAKIIQ